MKEPKPKKEPKPVPLRYVVKEISTNTILLEFPPTTDGKRRANRYKGLADIEIVEQY